MKLLAEGWVSHKSDPSAPSLTSCWIAKQRNLAGCQKKSKRQRQQGINSRSNITARSHSRKRVVKDIQLLNSPKVTTSSSKTSNTRSTRVAPVHAEFMSRESTAAEELLLSLSETTLSWNVMHKTTAEHYTFTCYGSCLSLIWYVLDSSPINNCFTAG